MARRFLYSAVFLYACAANFLALRVLTSQRYFGGSLGASAGPGIDDNDDTGVDKGAGIDDGFGTDVGMDVGIGLGVGIAVFEEAPCPVNALSNIEIEIAGLIPSKMPSRMNTGAGKKGAPNSSIVSIAEWG